MSHVVEDPREVAERYFAISLDIGDSLEIAKVSALAAAQACERLNEAVLLSDLAIGRAQRCIEIEKLIDLRVQAHRASHGEPRI